MSAWLCVDPGETTGWSIWSERNLVLAGQAPLWKFIDAVDAWLMLDGSRDGAYDVFTQENVEGYDLGAFVVEDWKLYPWELENLAWDACRTARGIGALELLARQHGIPFHLQGADIKAAAQAAGAEALYLEPVHENRHANDSIQHGVFYLANHGLEPPC